VTTHSLTNSRRECCEKSNEPSVLRARAIVCGSLSCGPSDYDNNFKRGGEGGRGNNGEGR
jgi:hypothetical protein